MAPAVSSRRRSTLPSAVWVPTGPGVRPASDPDRVAIAQVGRRATAQRRRVWTLSIVIVRPTVAGAIATSPGADDRRGAVAGDPQRVRLQQDLTRRDGAPLVGPALASSEPALVIVPGPALRGNGHGAWMTCRASPSAISSEIVPDGARGRWIRRSPSPCRPLSVWEKVSGSLPVSASRTSPSDSGLCSAPAGVPAGRERRAADAARRRCPARRSIDAEQREPGALVRAMPASDTTSGCRCPFLDRAVGGEHEVARDAVGSAAEQLRCRGLCRSRRQATCRHRGCSIRVSVPIVPAPGPV